MQLVKVCKRVNHQIVGSFVPVLSFHLFTEWLNLLQVDLMSS